MPVYLGVWRASSRTDYNLPPPDPNERRWQFERFHHSLTMEHPGGWVSEAHIFTDGDGGYFITKEIDRDCLEEELGRWFPRTVFEVQVHETVPDAESVRHGLATSRRSGPATS